jgi:hypothetical protein
MGFPIVHGSAAVPEPCAAALGANTNPIAIHNIAAVSFIAAMLAAASFFVVESNNSIKILL